MSYMPGAMDIRRSILEILASQPRHPENRLALLRLLWETAAGPIITGHTEIKTCTSDDRLVLDVDDQRWIKEIQRVSEIILERINQMLLGLNCPEYTIHALITNQTNQKRKDVKKVKNLDSIRIPAELLESSSEMGDELRQAFLKWYRTVNLKD